MFSVVNSTQVAASQLSHLDTDTAAIGTAVARIAVIARIIDTDSVTLAPEASKASAKLARVNADSRFVTSHTASLHVRIVHANMTFGAGGRVHAEATARLKCRC